jgi:hypothetical protein
MTLNNFEELCDKVFAERLLAIRDAENSERLLDAVCSELESVALSSGLEVCKRGAYLLTFARYDMHLFEHREELGVPDDYFQGEREMEQQAFNYLHQRRCGALARHL